MTNPSDNKLIAKILRDTAARITAADAKVHEANCAFQSGEFKAYMDREYEQVKKDLDDEYERIMSERGLDEPDSRSSTGSGDREESG